MIQDDASGWIQMESIMEEQMLQYLFSNPTMIEQGDGPESQAFYYEYMIFLIAGLW